MANWLNIVGGAGQGYVQGQGDLQRLEEHRQRKVEHEQRKAEFAHMQNQRARLEAEQKSDDELAAELGRVRPEGEYTDEIAVRQGIETEPGFVGAPSGVEKKVTKVTAPQADRARADVLAKTGKLKHLTAASQMRQGAYATEAAARAEQMAKGEDVLREAGRLRAAGNLAGAVRLLQKGYAQVPDGQDIVIEMKDGVQHIGVAGPGGFTQPLQPLTEKAVDDMIAKGWAMTSPERANAQAKLGIDREQLEVQRITAEAAKQNAETARKKAEWETIGEGGSAELAKKKGEVAYIAAHARYMDAAAAHQRSATAGSKFGPGVPYTDKNTGETVILAQDARTGEWRQTRLPANLAPPKLPQQLSDVQRETFKAELADHKALVEAGKYPTTVEANAALQAIIKKYDNSQGGGDIGTLQRADPRIQSSRTPFAAAPEGVSPSTYNIWGVTPSAAPVRGAAPASAKETPKAKEEVKRLENKAAKRTSSFPDPVDVDPQNPGPVSTFDPFRPAPAGTIFQSPWR